MELAELRQEVWANLGLNSADALAPPSRVDRWLNGALRTISTERHWYWLDAVDEFDTAEDTTDYDLPENYRATRSMSIDGRMMRGKNVELADTHLNQDDFTTDFEFSLDFSGAGAVIITPTPGADREVKHRYVTNEPVLSDDEDEPLLPDEWTDALTLLAASRGARAIDDYAKSDRLKAEADVILRQMRNQPQRRQGTRRVRVRPGNFM